MHTAAKHLPPLHMPRLFNMFEQHESIEILLASQLTSRLFWPEVTEERSRSLYMTLGLRKVHDVLLETHTEEAAQAVFSSILKSYFGGWQQYSRNLALVHFPSQGKGSLPERSWQGSVAGMLFLHAFYNEVSLSDAAKAVSEELYSAANAEIIDGLPKPSPENIMKNYWPRFQNVAHFWGAMQSYVLPAETDSIIRLDKAVPKPEMDGKILPGWRGIVDFAHDYLKRSADVKRYKTHKPLLDQETAFRVIFEG